MDDSRGTGAKFLGRSIVKAFGTTIAVRDVDLELYPGEIHAVLGENGAGKSTLMKLVAGVIQPDRGEMFIDGDRYRPASPKQAMRHGVGLVPQDYQLVGRLTAAENLFLGWRGVPRVAGFRRIVELAEEVAQRYGLDVPMSRRVDDLPVGQQQYVAILRVLVRGADIVILDEPTTTLTPQEVLGLFAITRRLAAENKSIVFISHKLREILEISTRVTVLRLGSKVGSHPVEDCDERSLAREMLGRDLAPVVRTRAPRSESRSPALRVRGVDLTPGKDAASLTDLSFDVGAGEIVGIAGVAGNGQRELSEVVTGVMPPSRGSVLVAGHDVTGKDAAAYAAAGVGHIPEDRLHEGMMLGHSIAHNAALKLVDVLPYRTRLRSGPWFRHTRATALAHELIEEGQLSTKDPRDEVGTLSGGNVQRLLIARELRISTTVLVAVHPTRGLDVGATERAWQLMFAARDRGAGVLLVSEDLDEILELSDRVLVMYSGRIAGGFDNRLARPSREKIGLLMGGAAEQAEAVGGAPSTARPSGDPAPLPGDDPESGR